MLEIQKFSKDFQKKMKWDIKTGSYSLSKTSLLNNYMLLTTEVSEIAEEFRRSFNLTNSLINDGIEEENAFELAKCAIKKDLGKELADCIAYITKFANYFEIDLEESYYEKMNEVKNRKNKDVSIKE